MRLVLPLLAVLCCLTASPVLAGDTPRPALFVQAGGEARPLREILAVLRGSYPGQVLDARLFENNGAMYYEIKILGPDNRVVELIVTADTGQVVSQR
jgi:uncharacterized membrane protein YkoI